MFLHQWHERKINQEQQQHKLRVKNNPQNPSVKDMGEDSKSWFNWSKQLGIPWRILAYSSLNSQSSCHIEFFSQCPSVSKATAWIKGAARLIELIYNSLDLGQSHTTSFPFYLPANCWDTLPVSISLSTIKTFLLMDNKEQASNRNDT